MGASKIGLGWGGLIGRALISDGLTGSEETWDSFSAGRRVGLRMKKVTEMIAAKIKEKRSHCLTFFLGGACGGNSTGSGGIRLLR